MKKISKKKKIWSQLVDLVLTVIKSYYIDTFHLSEHGENRGPKLRVIANHFLRYKLNSIYSKVLILRHSKA